jgi:hypothetical protein
MRRRGFFAVVICMNTVVVMHMYGTLASLISGWFVVVVDSVTGTPRRRRRSVYLSNSVRSVGRCLLDSCLYNIEVAVGV